MERVKSSRQLEGPVAVEYMEVNIHDIHVHGKTEDSKLANKMTHVELTRIHVCTLLYLRNQFPDGTISPGLHGNQTTQC